MKIDMADVVKEKGSVIAIKIFEKYGENPVIEHRSFWGGFLDGLLGGNGYSLLKVEREVYERSLNEATAFFLNNTDAKFDEKIIETLKFQLNSRLKYPNNLKKLKPEEILANAIKIYALDVLLEKGLVL